MFLSLILSVALAGESESGFDHSYADLDAFYDGAVGSSGIDYGTLAKRRDKLDAALAAIRKAPVDSFSSSQKLALYVNGYNAWTLATVLDAMPLTSIMELDGGKVWDTRSFTVGGESLTLNQIENERIRKLGDGRIHAVVNCASKGCPPLPEDPLRPSTAEAQLTAAAKTWAATNAYAIEGSTLKLSKVFDWYAADFTPYVEADLPGLEGKGEAAASFLDDFVSDEQKTALHGGTLTVAWTEYDWSLNQR